MEAIVDQYEFENYMARQIQALVLEQIKKEGLTGLVRYFLVDFAAEYVIHRKIQEVVLSTIVKNQLALIQNQKYESFALPSFSTIELFERKREEFTMKISTPLKTQILEKQIDDAFLKLKKEKMANKTVKKEIDEKLVILKKNEHRHKKLKQHGLQYLESSNEATLFKEEDEEYNPNLNNKILPAERIRVRE